MKIKLDTLNSREWEQTYKNVHISSPTLLRNIFLTKTKSRIIGLSNDISYLSNIGWFGTAKDQTTDPSYSMPYTRC